MKTKLKRYYLILSTHFPAGHYSRGEQTNFITKLHRGEKLHTIRKNYSYWSKRIDNVVAGNAVLELRYWSGVPYHSKMVTITRLYGEDVSYQKIKDLDVKTSLLAKNDGLTPLQFADWFKLKNTNPEYVRSVIGEYIVIHFRQFKYPTCL